ncbi:MAG: hypothetical protein ABIT10_04640 [Alteraurantiacibacter sp.]
MAAQKSRLILENLSALFLAVVVATMLTTAYTFGAELLAQSQGLGMIFITPFGVALIAARYSATVASLVAFSCVPIWMLFGKLGRQSYRSAAALGFAATISACWLLKAPEYGIQELPQWLPYCFIGALAGVVCWRFSPAKRAQ